MWVPASPDIEVRTIEDVYSFGHFTLQIPLDGKSSSRPKRIGQATGFPRTPQAINTTHVDAERLRRGENHSKRENVPSSAERDNAPGRAVRGTDQPRGKHRHRAACDQIGAGVSEGRAGIPDISREGLPNVEKNTAGPVNDAASNCVQGFVGWYGVYDFESLGKGVAPGSPPLNLPSRYLDADRSPARWKSYDLQARSPMGNASV